MFKRQYEMSLIIFFGLLLCSYGEELPVIKQYYTVWESAAKSENMDLLYTIQRESQRQRERTTVTVINSIEQSKNIVTKSNGLFVLGELQNTFSILTLIRYLDFVNTNYYRRVSEIPLIAEYPAQQALVKLGLKAVPQMLNEYLTTSEPERRKIILSLLQKVYTQGVYDQEGLEMFSVLLISRIGKVKTTKKREELQKEFNTYFLEQREIIRKQN